MIVVNLVTCIYFHLFEALNDAFEVQFFQGIILTPYIYDTDSMYSHAVRIF